MNEIRQIEKLANKLDTSIAKDLLAAIQRHTPKLLKPKTRLFRWIDLKLIGNKSNTEQQALMVILERGSRSWWKSSPYWLVFEVDSFIYYDVRSQTFVAVDECAGLVKNICLPDSKSITIGEVRCWALGL